MMFLNILLATSVIVGLTAASSLGTPLLDCLGHKSVPFKVISDGDWAKYSIPYNTRLPYTPAAIALPDNIQHISDTVICAASAGVKVQAKSGGHSYASFSLGGKDGSMMIDLQKLQTVTIDNATGIATVGGGLRLGNMALALEPHGRALAHGTCAGVGVGGHFSHGGYGFMSRSWGLALDQIVALDVVMADGKLVHASETENPDLYYVMRGAPDSFGIIVNFYLQTHSSPPSVVWFTYQFTEATTSVEKAVTAFNHIQDMAHNASAINRDIGFGIYIGKNTFNLRGIFVGTAATFNATIQPEFLRGLPTPDSTLVQETSWIDSLAILNGGPINMPLTEPYPAHDNFFAKSVTVPEPGFTQSALTSFFSYILNQGNNYPTTPVQWFSIIDLYGGADSQINTKTVDFAPFPGRNLAWTVQNYGFVGANETFPDEGVAFVDGLNDAIVNVPLEDGQLPYAAYINYIDASLSAEEAHAVYYGPELYAKLSGLKAKLDPGNVFANPQSITAN